MARVSLALPWVSAGSVATSQQFREVCGKTRMKPCSSAASTIPPSNACPNTTAALPPQKCTMVRRGAPGATSSGTYTYMETHWGSVPCCQPSIGPSSAAADAGALEKSDANVSATGATERQAALGKLGAFSDMNNPEKPAPF